MTGATGVPAAPPPGGCRTIYLHIGFPKTGTSTIQEGLTLNHDALCRAGWYIPQSGKIFPDVDAHHNLALEVREATEFDRGRGTLDDLLAELGRARRGGAILSTEMFSPTLPHQIERLRERLAGHRVVVVAYVRRQDLWLHSMWVELCKFPRKKVLKDDFPRWIDKLIARKGGAVENFFSVVDAWGRVFGVDNVRVRVLEKSQIAKNVFHDFLVACDVPEPGRFAVPEDKNVSPGIKPLEILRYLMPPLTSAFRDAELPYQDRKTMVISNFVLRYAAQRGWNERPAYVLTDETHRKIMDFYGPSNRALAQKYLGRDELFLETYRGKPVTAFALAELPAAEALDLLLFVLPRLVNWTAHRAAPDPAAPPAKGLAAGS